ncbi:hypothetical protein AB0A74_00825 [Saccharothrix sp. NPDC042600]|uniref:hypothetical protein n=1 Tax=Saccharothrix TaxID=2071 RepID=UPI0033DD793D|nr:hypothetical protein GCM10017745_48660 [Saccharothrix mutabilis subsp. capreolus]
MGDLHRHAEIFRHVHAVVSPLRPGEDYICLEMGNYLTDISQFRDPFALMYGKRIVWQRGLSESIVLSVLQVFPVIGLLTSEAVLNWAVDLDEWIDRMFGVHEPPEQRHGKLAQYFGHVFAGITQLVFADDVPKGALWRPAFAPALGDLARLPSAEVGRIYDEFLTQYYPHEHMDLPPYVLYGEHRAKHRLYRRGPRGLIAYLEEYVEYLSESLSKLEVEWKGLAGTPAGDPRRHDVLVKLGKALHGVEDFFFHTNHVELHLWHELRSKRPRGETEEYFREWFAKNAHSRLLPPDEPHQDSTRHWTPERHQRIRALMRRLRYPVYRPVDKLDPETSESALNLVYSGGFGSKDVFHTLSMALESMEASVQELERSFQGLPRLVKDKWASKNPSRLRGSRLVLVRALFDHEYRSELGNSKTRLEEELALHADQLRDGVYERGIHHLHEHGYLNDAARDAWLAAVALDREMEDFGVKTPGIGGFLIALLAEGQRELEKSRLRSQAMDNSRDHGPGNVFDTRSDNGATGEQVGTHTLMSKDTAISHPMHEEVKRIARFASMAVARHLVVEVTGYPSVVGGLDWDRILRHYLRFPHARADTWESQVLGHVRRTMLDPTYDDIPDRVRQPRVEGPQGAARLAARRSGSRRSELEKRYTDLEERVDHFQLLLPF